MSYLSNLRIVSKLALAFAFIIVTLVASSVLIWNKMSFIEDTTRWTSHTHNVLEKLNGAMAAMVDQETGLRGFLVSGDEGFLAPFKNGQAVFADLVNDAKQLTSDNAQQQERLAKMEQLAATWVRDIAEKEIALMRDPLTRERAREMEASGAGKASMDGIRALIGDADKAERDLLGQRNQEQADAFAASEFITVAAGIISIVIAVLACFVLARAVASPVRDMTAAMKILSAGDTSVKIPAVGRTDEVGQMAETVEVFKQSMIETERMRKEQEEAKKRAEAERRQMMLDLADKFEAQVGGVVNAVTSAASELQATAQSLSATAEETSRQSNAVAAASEQMAQNVQTVASATEELSSSIREIGNQVTESSRIVGTAVTQAQDTNGKVKALAEAAQKIGDVVTLINEIAAQTNLLALNATIEAARAGEAGKGFAVVASEVKNLATQTAKATEEIAGQVRAIQDATGTSAQAIESIATTINRVNEISTAIASAVEEQGAATQEISRNVQETSRGTQEVTNNISGVTQASQQTSAGSTQVLSPASELAKNGEILRAEVGKFLATVRAA